MIEAVKRLRFEKEKQRRECALTYKISRSKRYNACSDVAKSRNFDRKRVSLSIRALLEPQNEADQQTEAQPEEVKAQETPAESAQEEASAE